MLLQKELQKVAVQTGYGKGPVSPYPVCTATTKVMMLKINNFLWEYLCKRQILKNSIDCLTPKLYNLD